MYFEPGETRKTVRVPLLADTEREDEETVRLRLVEAHASWPYDLVVDIAEDEAQGTILDGPGRGRVSREAPLTARFAQAPDEHDGASAFTLRVAFSDSVTIGKREFRDHGIEVTGGPCNKGARGERPPGSVGGDGRAGILLGRVDLAAADG